MLNLIMLQTMTENGGLVNIVMIVALIAIFYLFMIRPQQKKAKALRNFREGIREGQKVVTAGGIYGKVKQIKETSFVLEIATGVCITIDKNSVYESPADVQAAPQAENKN